jgi:hypothetical protein
LRRSDEEREAEYTPQEIMAAVEEAKAEADAEVGLAR